MGGSLAVVGVGRLEDEFASDLLCKESIDSSHVIILPLTRRE